MAFMRAFGGPNQPTLDEQQKQIYDEHMVKFRRCEKESNPDLYRDCHTDVKQSYNTLLKRLIRDDSQNPMNQSVCDFKAAMADLRKEYPTDSKRDLIGKAGPRVHEQKKLCESAITVYQNMLRRFPTASRYSSSLETYLGPRFQLPAPSRPNDITNGNQRLRYNVNSLLSHPDWINSAFRIEEDTPAPTSTPTIKQS